MFQSGKPDAGGCTESREAAGIQLNEQDGTIETEGNDPHVMILALGHLLAGIVD